MLPECKKKSLAQEVCQKSDVSERRILLLFFILQYFQEKKNTAPSKKSMKNGFGGTFDDFLWEGGRVG